MDLLIRAFGRIKRRIKQNPKKLKPKQLTESSKDYLAPFSYLSTQAPQRPPRNGVSSINEMSVDLCRDRVSFLDLPGEVRNQIYRPALVFNGIRPMAPDCYPYLRDVVVEIGWTSRWDEDWRDGIISPLVPFMQLDDLAVDTSKIYGSRKEKPTIPTCEVLAVLSTCKQIYHEARTIFWAENTFVFSTQYDQWAFVRGLGQDRRNLITKLGLRIICHEHWVPGTWYWVQLQLDAKSEAGLGTPMCRSPVNEMIAMFSDSADDTGTFVKESEESFRPWDERTLGTFLALQYQRERYHSQTGLPLLQPLDGRPRLGSIYDRGSSGVLADYEAGNGTSIDILGDAIRQCKAEGHKGWKYWVEHRDRENFGPFGKLHTDDPHKQCILWMERSKS